MPLVITRKPLESSANHDQSEFTVYTSDGTVTVKLLSCSTSRASIEIDAPPLCDIERADMKLCKREHA